PLFFFSSRRRHTSFSRDWSSDVALPISREPAYRPLSPRAGVVLERALFPVRPARALRLLAVPAQSWKGLSPEQGPRQPWTRPEEIGRAACREGGSPPVGVRPSRKNADGS